MKCDKITLDFTESELMCIKDALREYANLYKYGGADVKAEIDGILEKIHSKRIETGGAYRALDEIFILSFYRGLR